MRLKTYHLNYKIVSNEVPRRHQFNIENRIIKTVSLTAPSGAVNRAVGSTALYKRLKMRIRILIPLILGFYTMKISLKKNNYIFM